MRTEYVAIHATRGKRNKELEEFHRGVYFNKLFIVAGRGGRDKVGNKCTQAGECVYK